MAGTLQDRRLALTLLGLFAAVALILAAVGVYGVFAYMVAARSRELGIRLALGAAPGGVLRLVLGQGLRLAVVGIALGLAGAVAVGRLLQGLLWEISATDPPTLAGVTFVLLATAVVACLVPARRAARVDPMVALRDE